MMPWASVFGSRIYERSDEAQPAIGEKFSPVPWRTGKPPYPVPAGGICGTEHQWSGGASIADPLPPLWPGSSVPRCCSPPIETWTGGTAVGGRPLTAPCCGLSSLPRVVKLFHTVTAGACPVIDGIPFFLYPTDYTPPIMVSSDLVARWRSDEFFLEGMLRRFYLACNTSSLVWFTVLIGSPAPEDAFGGTRFLTATCEPFVLDSPLGETFIITGIMCGITGATVQVTVVAS